MKAGELLLVVARRDRDGFQLRLEVPVGTYAEEDRPADHDDGDEGSDDDGCHHRPEQPTEDDQASLEQRPLLLVGHHLLEELVVGPLLVGQHAGHQRTYESDHTHPVERVGKQLKDSAHLGLLVTASPVEKRLNIL